MCSTFLFLGKYEKVGRANQINGKCGFFVRKTGGRPNESA
jgi:hypothetical protein